MQRENLIQEIVAAINNNGKQQITGSVLQEQLINMVGSMLDSDGKYPQMTSGFANNLVGRGEAVDATINFRASGGKSIEDGAARVKELKGNSVVMNQQIYGDFRNGSAGWDTDRAGIHMSVTNGVAELYATTDGDNYVQSLNDSFVLGHKYMFLGESKTTASGVTIFYLFYGNANNLTTLESTSTGWEQKSAFFQCASTTYNFVRMQCPKAGVTHQYRNLLLVDLTQMFGQGNEPTTLEDFYARIPQNVDLYAYNEGEIVSTNADGIKSVGFNAWDEEWKNGYYDSTSGIYVYANNQICNKNMIPVIGGQSYYYANLGIGRIYASFYFYDENKILIGNKGFAETIVVPQNAKYMCFNVGSSYGATYNHDICINLSHSGYRNGEYQPYMQFIRNLDNRIKEAFPNGLRSAGSASDKVYNKNGKGYIEKRIGVVDMGALPWVSVSGIFKCDFSAYTKKHSSNILCSAYVTSSVREQEKTIYYADSFFGSYALTIKDSAYTNIDTFKAAVQGIPLYYELAEPIITEYDEPFNLDYEVWDFGTEQMLSSRPSAPIKAKIAYGFNAVDSVRTAQIEIAELKTQIAQMQTLMASLTASPAMLEE